MVRSVVLLGLLLVQGCDWVFGIELRDAPLIDARVAQPGCSGMRILADNFDDGTFEPQFISDQTPGNQVTVSGNALRMEMGGEGYAVAFSEHAYDLRDDSVSIEVHAENDVLPATGELRLEVRADELNALVLKRRGDLLLMIRRVAGQEFELARLAYDPAAHRFWRIGQQDDVTSWLTSSDGVDFVERATYRGLPFVAFMGVVLAASRDASTAAFTGWFDQLNRGMPIGEACPAFALTDDFADGVIGSQWRTATDQVVERDGHLVARVDLINTDAFIASTTVYDLRDGELSLELPQQPQGTVDTLLVVATEAGGRAMFRVRLGQIFASKNAGTDVGTEPYDPLAHRWWRLRVAGDNVYWEVSPDGTAYRVIGQANDVPGLERSGIHFGILGNPTTPMEATFDNVNVAP